MYVYQLTHVRGVEIKVIGYFGSWKKARQVMKNIVHRYKDLKTIRGVSRLRNCESIRMIFIMDKKNYVQMKNDGRKNFTQNDIRFKLDC